MATLKAAFLDNETIETENPDAYKEYFLFPDQNTNDYSNSGFFKFTLAQGDILLLFVNHKNTFSFRYDYNIPDSSTGASYYSLNNQEKINIIVDAGDEDFIPLGSCVSPEIAWDIVYDFFQDPTKRPEKIDWINAEQINWSSIQDEHQ